MAGPPDSYLEDKVTPDEARLALATVCNGRYFANSLRLRAFLEYIVEQALNGKTDELKEYSIGVDVFDRGTSFDPRTDTIVRVHAGRLRKKLAEHYSGDGLTDRIVIEVPKGGYVPTFRRRQTSRFQTDFTHREPAEAAKATEVREISNAVQLDVERVQATVVFSRVSGFDEFIEENDTAAVDLFTTRLGNLVADIVGRQGGVVNRFSGDEFVALFGIGSADEDSFSQAVRSTRALHDTVRSESGKAGLHGGRSLSLSSGIDTGTVRVREATVRTQAYQVVGDPTKIAGMLALHAGPDEVLLSRETNRLLSRSFETELRRPLQLEGSSRVLVPYRLVGEWEPSVLRDKGETPVFVGRENELDQLHERLQKTVNGAGQFVSIVGEAGIGKTRLLYEFDRQLAKNNLTFITAGCRPSDIHTPLFPFVQALSELLKKGDEVDGQITEQEALVQISKIDSHLEPYVPLLLHLLSIPSLKHPIPDHLKGNSLRLAFVDALTAILTLAAQQRGIVLVLEDWHWSDQASRDVLDQLIELLPSYRLMTVVTSRPDYLFSVSSHHLSLRLGPLECEESFELADSLLSDRQVSDEVKAFLHDRTNGNPFFLEEVCRGLAQDRDAGSVTLDSSLPVTVRSAIRARLQRLRKSDLQVLRIASVIGQEFGEGILRRVVGSDESLGTSLEGLRATGHIQRVSLLPQATYRFQHVLVQEAVYDGLLQHQRKALHQHVGEAIEALALGRTGEHFERLALHFQSAENWPKTIHYAQSASDKSWKMSQFDEALAMLEIKEHAVRMLPRAEENRRTLVDVLFQQERACETIGNRDRQEELIKELVSLLEPNGKSQRLTEVYIRQGDLYALRSQFSEGEATLKAALDVSRSLPDADLELRALRSMGFLYFRGNEPGKALPLTEEVVLRDRQGHSNPRVLLHDLLSLSNVLRSLGQHSRALDVAKEAGDLACQSDLRDELANTSFVIAAIHRDMGELDQALIHLEEALEHSPYRNARIVGSARKPAIILVGIANIHLAQRNFEEALRYGRDAVHWGRRSKMADELSAALRTLGLTLIALNRHADALPHLQEAEQLYARVGDIQDVSALKQAVANCFERIGDYSEAIRLMEDVLTFRRQEQDRHGEMEALELLARLTRAAGSDSARVQRLLRQALTLAESLEDRKRESNLHNTLGILEWHRENYEAALSHYENALRVCKAVGDDVHAGLMLNSIGVTLHKLGRLTEARSVLESALKVHRKNESTVLESHALAAIGDILYDERRFELAIQVYERSLNLRRELKDRKGEGWMLHHLARAWGAAGHDDKAPPLLERALAIARQEKILKLTNACQLLSGSPAFGESLDESKPHN